MKLGLAHRGSIFNIVEVLNCDAVLSIALSFTVSLDDVPPCFAFHLHSRTFEVFLVMRLLRIIPVIALVAIDFTDYLHNQRVMVGRWVGMWGIYNWWRRRIIIVRSG